MKSIIINGFEKSIAERLIKDNPFDQCFYIGLAGMDYLETDYIRTYDCFAIPLGNYPKDFFEAPPLDEDIVKMYVDCEVVVLKMFERNDFWFDTSYNQRKEWYLIHLRYWCHIVEKYNVICYLGSNFAHEVYDYIIMSIVRKRGGQTYFFSQLSFMNRFILETDFYSYNRLDNFLKIHKTSKIICDELKEYLETLRFPPNSVPVPFYMKIKEKRGNIKKQGKIQKIYNKKYAVDIDLNVRYIFVALHHQPEMTTCPLAGIYVHQELMIELLDFYLPSDIFIYVKEHPSQTSICRNEKFYSKFSKNSRVKFVRTTENSLKLLDSSLAVVTCAGTIGYEAMVRGKPVVMFGNFFYQFGPGVYMVKTHSDVKCALEDIVKGVSLNLGDVEQFFQKIYDFSYYGYVDSAYKSQINITESENIDNICQIVCREIFSKF